MSNLKKAALWTTGLALLLKLSGFIREAIVAKEFGASNETDGYFLAFSFITLVVAMISTGFNNVFLPMYIKRKKSGLDTGEQNANALLNWTMVIFGLISILGWFTAKQFVPIIYPNMKEGIEPYAVEMTQIFFAFMMLIALTGLLDSYLQSRRIFVPSQLAKLLATLMAAIFAIFFSDIWGIYSLVYGFVFGTILGVVIQLYFLGRSDYKWRMDFAMEPDFKKAFIILIIPSLLNSVVGQINLFVNKAFASGEGVANGAVTYLNNSSLLVSIPNAIYATTLAAIIFTLMSEQTEDLKKFKDTFFRGMEISLVTLLPIAIGLLVVGDAAVSFIYERGKFSADDTDKTYIALLWYLPIIVFQGMQLILSKSMYARGKTAVVFRISVTTILLNFLLNWWLVDDYGYPALAFAASVVSIYYFAISMIVVYRDLGMSEFARFARMSVRVVIPAVLMGLVVWGAKLLLGTEDWYSLIQLAVLVPIGIIVYALSLKVTYPTGFNRMLSMAKRSK
ncbi:polysaccharide biosynthesis C-terminal domain-containing protein [Paenisporosarcina quisquiliarum]|uniref:Polysaccharide biosynthesis C-terminal domain-containing protein n=1 Tax=Paenisporosarcina quisquiliarum TaxID=365346 RepID=A0A9X3LG06_9BACL|nr:lipid II flippase MurJ [Paenisporosarcina quisquiliarum]MCZ8536644.1 polysaccharide biosynthesis C-terminal domain-containing protein [Paenisporosarcina quisquiliarum]